jgi:hypothetical protein
VGPISTIGKWTEQRLRIQLDDLTAAELGEAVRAFDARYADMERVLWHLSLHSRDTLLEYGEPHVLEALIWTIRSWWGVQGARHETRSAMAQALLHMDWSPDLFEPLNTPAPGAEDYAVDLVAELVERCLERGVARREYSLASKVLHWLLPWRIPVYDSFVRLSVGVPEAWADREAYNRVTYRVLTAARNISAVDPAWIGSIEPRSTLRAFDKCFWWFGGGNAATAAEVKDPWRVVDDLGLKRPNPMC